MFMSSRRFSQGIPISDGNAVVLTALVRALTALMRASGETHVRPKGCGIRHSTAHIPQCKERVSVESGLVL